MSRIIRAVTATVMATTIGITTAAAMSATAAPAAATKAVRGAEHFSIVTTSSNIGVDESFIATGAVTAAGRDDAGRKVDRITLRGGGFLIRHAGRETIALDPRTCLLVEKGRGAFTLAAGRGAYRGITGSGSYVLSVRAVFPRTARGACAQNSDPIAIQYVVTANGHVVMP